MNNIIDGNKKMLKFLRVSNIFDTRDAAKNALNVIAHSAIGQQLGDGTPLLVKYGDTYNPHLLLGIYCKSEKGKTVTIFEDFDEIEALIDDLYEQIDIMSSDFYNQIQYLSGQTDDVRDLVMSAHEKIDQISGQTVQNTTDIAKINYQIGKYLYHIDLGTW